MPFTAASETLRSAFFRVSLVASIGPLSRRAVAEIERVAPTERTGVVVGRRDSEAVRAAGAMRARKDMVDRKVFELMGLRVG